MHITVSNGGRETDLQVDGLSPDVTLAAVVAGVGASPRQTVSIDGKIVDADAVAANELYEGALLGLDTAGQRVDPIYQLHATVGPAAGRVWRLSRGMYSVGPAGAAIGWTGGPNPAVALEVRRDGVKLDGAMVPVGQDFRIGEAWFRLRPAVTANPSRGAITFNRPPRLIASPDVPVLEAPVRKQDPGKPRRLGPVALVLPAIFGVAMALLFGRVMFLAFALLGPLMMIGSSLDDRRRRRRDRRDNELAFVEELVRFEGDMSKHATRAAAHRLLAHPSPSELLSHVDTAAPSLWERRPHHDDFMHIAIGIGDMQAPDSPKSDSSLEPEVRRAIERATVMRNVPVDIDLGAGRIVGVHGPSRTQVASAVRAWICAAAAQHGPADLRIAILTDSPARWDWAKWLPHVRATDGEIRLLAAGTDTLRTLLGLLRRRADAGATPPLTLLVSDLTAEHDDLRTIHREVIGGAGMPVAAIVIRDDRDALPGNCTWVVEIGDPQASVSIPSRAMHRQAVTTWTAAPDAARHLARRLARIDDPESIIAGSGIPDDVALLHALQLRPSDDRSITERWARAAPDSLQAVLGGTHAGVLGVDLVRDGPHGLLAGTTGSGKSELLRSMVASMAANHDPDHVNFVLIDYKGGSAFDACARLPHVVGVVTDLDEHLGARALTCLEAELRYRETLLRTVGASDIRAYGAIEGVAPLPRMVLVVDEFAVLAAELPDFMAALVDIAQRGRSLGVHMILATQRPAGVVKDSIRANTNLRICLRVQSAADANDVIGDPIASRTPRTRPGRAYLRLGPAELIPFQSAFTGLPHGRSDRPLARVTPFVFGMSDTRLHEAPPAVGPSELEVLVDAIVEANARAGFAPARRPWPDPLPERIGPSQLTTFELAPGDGFRLGVRDEPDLQRQIGYGWHPPTDGNLLLTGATGPTDTLRALAAAIAGRHPDEAHFYAIDHSAGALAPLAALPHCGGVIRADDQERQQRLMRMLQMEIAHRRNSSSIRADVFLMIDGLGGFRAAFDEVADLDYRDALARISADGPPVGVYTALTALQARTIPTALLGLFRSRLVFQMADRLDYAALGVSARDVPELGPGRAVDVATGRHVQIVTFTDADISDLGRGLAGSRSAPPVEAMPTVVKLADLIDRGRWTDHELTLPAGIGAADLAGVTLSLAAGDHALISGSPRSGKSTMLASLAAAANHIDPACMIIAIGPRPSPLHNERGVHRTLAGAGELKAVLSEAPDRVLVLVDDADEVEDEGGAIGSFIRSRAAGRHLVAAARTDSLRGAFRHWTKTLRTARCGIVLCPLDPSDGEPIGVRLPRHLPPRMPAGRGYLSNGSDLVLLQTPIPGTLHVPAGGPDHPPRVGA